MATAVAALAIIPPIVLGLSWKELTRREDGPWDPHRYSSNRGAPPPSDHTRAEGGGAREAEAPLPARLRQHGARQGGKHGGQTESDAVASGGRHHSAHHGGPLPPAGAGARNGAGAHDGRFGRRRHHHHHHHDHERSPAAFERRPGTPRV